MISPRRRDRSRTGRARTVDRALTCISKSEVSRRCATLDAAGERFRTRPLTGEYPSRTGRARGERRATGDQRCPCRIETCPDSGVAGSELATPASISCATRSPWCRRGHNNWRQRRSAPSSRSRMRRARGNNGGGWRTASGIASYASPRCWMTRKRMCSPISPFRRRTGD